MRIADITKLAGAHKRRKRVGRGPGSGHGKTSTRGHNGGGSRSGWKTRGLAEGGQMPLFRRLPKRGFNNFNFRTEFSIVNVSDLEDRFDADAHVTGPSLVEVGLVRNMKLPIKILGNGDLKKKLVVEADKFSKQAAQKIQSAGGEARWLQPVPEVAPARSKSKSKTPAVSDSASSVSPAEPGAADE